MMNCPSAMLNVTLAVSVLKGKLSTIAHASQPIEQCPDIARQLVIFCCSPTTHKMIEYNIIPHNCMYL